MTAEADEPRKRRKYTTAERLAILKTAAKVGPVEAARHHGVPQATVSNWLHRDATKVAREEGERAVLVRGLRHKIPRLLTLAGRTVVPHPDLDLDIPPLLTASVLLVARQFALASGISWPGIEDILAATGASPEEAHEIEDALLDQLAALAVMAKRQTPPPDLAGLDRGADLAGLAVEVVRFLKRNPGCAQSGTREWYADCFHQFVLELRWRYSDVTTAEFATAIDLPLDTVEDWLRGGHRGVHAPAGATYPRPTCGARARLA